MLQNPCKTLGFKKNMVYKIPPGGGGKPYPASGLIWEHAPGVMFFHRVIHTCYLGGSESVLHQALHLWLDLPEHWKVYTEQWIKYAYNVGE